ncbi:hypothetical protein XENORESO_012993, partial [Xenotaenia resolanae]
KTGILLKAGFCVWRYVHDKTTEAPSKCNMASVSNLCESVSSCNCVCVCETSRSLRDPSSMRVTARSRVPSSPRQLPLSGRCSFSGPFIPPVSQLSIVMASIGAGPLSPSPTSAPASLASSSRNRTTLICTAVQGQGSVMQISLSFVHFFFFLSLMTSSLCKACLFSSSKCTPCLQPT